jgi:oligoendopeptidase F
MMDTPLTVAETASVFGEMLTFKSLFKRLKTDEERKALLASKIEDMLNTVVRQVAFADFELRVHALRQQRELSLEDFQGVWRDVQEASLGSSVDTQALEYANYWSYISHFYHTPFYVYAYAFGDCLVNALYATYESGLPDFEQKYIDLLRAGGSKRYDQLLAPFNLDAKRPDFWQKGLNVIRSMIEDFEQLVIKNG